MGILAFGYTEIGEAHERVTRTLELESHLSSSRVWINRGSTEVLASIISGVAKGAVEATRASGTAAGSAFLEATPTAQRRRHADRREPGRGGVDLPRRASLGGHGGVIAAHLL